MGLINSIRSWFKGKPKVETKTWPNWTPLGGYPLTGTDFFGRRSPSPDQLIQAFEDTVYACTSLIADTVSSTPVRLYVRTEPGQARPKCQTRPLSRKNLRHLQQTKSLARGIQVEEVCNHPVLELLNSCNSYHNRNDLLTLTQLFLEMTGNAFWLVRHDGFGIPTGLYLLPTQYMSPDRDEAGMVKAWKFGIGNEEVTYQTDEIVHFKFPSLQDPYAMGHAPLQAAWNRVEIQFKEMGFLDSTLSNFGRPDAILSPSEPISPFEAERLAKEYLHRFRGQGNGGIFVADGPMQLTPISWPMKDFAELNLYQAVKNSVSNVFHIPPDIWDMGQANRATAEAILYALAVHCIKPRMIRLVEKLNERLIPYYDDRLFFEADDVVPEDKQFELQERQMLLSSGVLTRNEVRLMYGFEPREWANEPLLPPGMMPALADEVPAIQNQEQEPQEQDRSSQAPTLAQIQGNVYAGQLPREAAIALVQLTFGFTPDQAQALFPDVPVKKPDQADDQEQPGQQQAPEQPKAVKCGGPGGKPGPCPDPGAEGPAAGAGPKLSATAARQHQAISKVIDKQGNLSDDQKAAYKQAVGQALSQMPDKALDRFGSNVQRMNFYGSFTDLTEDLGKSNPALAEKLHSSGHVAFGSYKADEKRLRLDGARGREAGSDVVGQTRTNVHETYAHEFSHAIDGPGFPHSSSPEWQSAWKEEIAGSPKLSGYAAKSPPHEGFAEFGRLLYGTDYPLADVEKKFPKSSAYFKQQGFWPNRTKALKAEADDDQEQDGPALDDIFTESYQDDDGTVVDAGPAPEQDGKSELSDCVSRKIPKLLAEGYPQDQAEAIAYSYCQEKALKARRKAFRKKSPLPMAAALQRFFKKQSQELLAKTKSLEAKALPMENWFDIEHWTREMAEAMRPTVALYYDYAAKATVTRIGASLDLLKVSQPKLQDGIDKATMQFCRETNETTSQQLDQAIKALRQEMTTGLEAGEVQNQLTKRVQGIFEEAEVSRAYRIAVTEASRGQHAAQTIVAKESGFVKGKRWILSDDACDLCKPLAGKVVGLDDDFTKLDQPGPYSAIPYPPLHPHCRCDMIEVIEGVND